MVSVEPRERDADATHELRGHTTIELHESGAAGWRATQRGVDLVGHGETPAAAAAAYCLRVDAREE